MVKVKRDYYRLLALLVMLLMVVAAAVPVQASDLGAKVKRVGSSKPQKSLKSLAPLLSSNPWVVNDCLSLSDPSDPTKTPEQILVQSLVGANVPVSNIQLTGVPTSAGYFKTSVNIIGFGEGIILSSGDVHNVVGPNQTDGITASYALSGDKDLDQLIGSPTYDATVLEFDFVPDYNTIAFQYVFASDEYNEYVNSYNDVFGFIVNGQNVAKIPGSDTVVSINNVNRVINSEFYINNDLSDGGGAINTEMDGLTTVLTVNAQVNKGVTNHIKLAIADAMDTALDSNVFIKANSFIDTPNNPPVANPDYVTTNTSNPLTIDVLSNDSDVDGDPLMVTAVSQPAQGSVALGANGKNVIYSPTSGLIGQEVFTYTISDGRGGTASADVTVNLEAIPPPDVLNFSYFKMTGNLLPFKGPTDSVVDSTGNLFVTDYYNNRIVKFDKNEQFLGAYGTLGSDVGQFNKPSGITIDASDNIFVADTYNNRIVSFKDTNGNGSIESGEKWKVWGGTVGTDVLQFNKPMGVSIKGNQLYVADTYNHRIATFEPDYEMGTWATFGTKGSQAGQFNAPYDVAVDSQGNLWVSDTFNNRVQEFDQSKLYKAQKPVDYPYGIAIDKNDNVFVAERQNAYIKCVNNPKTYGGKGTTAGLFKSPVGVNIDSTGKVWVVDVTTGKIQFAMP